MKKILFTFLILIMASPCFAYDWCADSDTQACYLMDVDENPITDSSQNSNTGALKAAGTPNYTASGKFDGGYDWNNSASDYILVTDDNTIDIGTSDFTFVIWINRESISAGDHYVFDKAATSNNGYQLFFKANVPRFRLDAGTGSVGNFNTTVTTTGTFIHYAIGGDRSGNASFYLDGVADGTLDISGDSGDASSATNLYIGSSEIGTASQDGIMDEFAIITRLLDSTDINDIMDNGLSPSDTAPTYMIFR